MNDKRLVFSTFTYFFCLLFAVCLSLCSRVYVADDGCCFPHLYPVDKLGVPSGQEDEQQQKTHGRTDADPHSRSFSGGAVVAVEVKVC